MQAQLRPYLLLEKLEVVGLLDPNADHILTVQTFKNWGSTPAWIEAYRIEYLVGREPEPGHEWGQLMRSGSVIPPKEDDKAATYGAFIKESEEILRKMRAGDLAIMIIGIVKYRGANSGSHTLVFCANYVVIKGEFKRVIMYDVEGFTKYA